MPHPCLPGDRRDSAMNIERPWLIAAIFAQEIERNTEGRVQAVRRIGEGLYLPGLRQHLGVDQVPPTDRITIWVRIGMPMGYRFVDVEVWEVISDGARRLAGKKRVEAADWTGVPTIDDGVLVDISTAPLGLHWYEIDLDGELVNRVPMAVFDQPGA